MSDRKTNTGGQSDSTVMLRVDDQGRPIADESSGPQPQPGQSDSTVLGMQMPNFDDDHPTQDEVPNPMSNADRLRAKPLQPASPASQPPKAATGVRPALSNPGVGGSQPPKRATGMRQALSDPGVGGSQPPRAATGVRPALSNPGVGGSQPPRAATGVRPALSNPGVGGSQPPKRATGMRQALPEPPPEGAGETLMLNPDTLLKAGQAAQKAADPGPEAANATVMFSAVDSAPAAKPAARGNLAGDDKPTAAKNLARDDKPTASKRPLQDLVDGGGRDENESSDGGLDEGNPDTFRGENTALDHKARTTNGMYLVTSGLMLLIAGAVLAHFIAGRVATPSRDELLLLYPFGAGGKVMPNGRTAPPARTLVFDMVKADDCDGLRCLTYHVHSEDNGFNYEMLVRDNDGIWGLVSGKLSEPLSKK
ncbi:MAG: hypothetical protein JST54_20735 [Deltaproteobacteria bacterium]|nr:hypothetical protein [Deltaproteobacteria bacterium]